MDNVSLHKVAGVGEAIVAEGASVLYLPAYSPDFDPVEKLFSKCKSVLKRIAAHTADALRSVMPEECANYFAACGYDAF